MCLSVYQFDIEHLKKNRKRYEEKLYYKNFKIYEDKTFRTLLREINGGTYTRDTARNLISEYANPFEFKYLFPSYLKKLILIPTISNYKSSVFKIGEYHFNQTDRMSADWRRFMSHMSKPVQYKLGYHAYMASHFEQCRKLMQRKFHWNVGHEYPLLLGYSRVNNYFYTTLPVILSDITAVGRFGSYGRNKRCAVVGKTMLILDPNGFTRYVNRQYTDGIVATDAILKRAAVTQN